MGKARIIATQKDGLYTVEMDYSLPGQDAERLSLIAMRDQLTKQIAEAAEALVLKIQEVTQTEQTLTAMIEDWQTRALADKDQDPPVDPDKEDPEEPPPQEGVDMTGAAIAAHNVIRAQQGLGSLSVHTALTTAAQAHAQWMVRNTVGHTGAGGSSPKARMLAAGYPYGPGAHVGENVAGGQDSATRVMADWMASPGHKANIVKPEYTQIGIGYVYSPGSAYRHYWVACFGRPPN